MPLRRGHMVARQSDEDVLDFIQEVVAVNAAAAQQAPPSIQKRVVTVYTTLTSSGWTGGDLTTIYPGSSTDKSTKDTKTTSSEADLETAKGIGAQRTSTSAASPSLPTAIEASTAAQTNVGSSLAVDGSDPTSSTLVATSTAASSTATSATAASASASSTSSASSGSSGSDAASKAGIALGILGGLFIVLAFVYWMITRRRKQMEEQRRLADDEKLNGPFADVPPPQTPAKAPRLSLRPMTQLFTGFNASNQNDHQANKGSEIAMVASPTSKRAPGASAWERPMTSDSQNERNPFGNHAQIVEQPATPKQHPMSPMTPISEASVPSPEFTPGLKPAPRVSAVTTDSATVPSIITKDLPRSPSHSSQVSPVESLEEGEVGRAISTPEVTPAHAGTMLSAGAAATATAVERRQSMRQEHVPAPIDLTLPPKLTDAVPPSPAGTEFSMHEVDADQSPVHSSSAAAIAAAGGPVNTMVHRVQLDFKPTMDDEMKLTAGQLVRLLHEYDDGWALCIRLDRSQQGVVPRTCLSTRPVKPRAPPNGARGPPVNPQGRPRDPSVSSQRGPGPNYPPGARPMGPPHPLGPGGQRGPGYPRPAGPPMGPPMGPPGPRPQSPAGQQRPQSPNAAGRKQNPPGPTNMQQEYRPNLERKPVPGQAY